LRIAVDAIGVVVDVEIEDGAIGGPLVVVGAATVIVEIGATVLLLVRMCELVGVVAVAVDAVVELPAVFGQASGGAVAIVIVIDGMVLTPSQDTCVLGAGVGVVTWAWATAAGAHLADLPSAALVATPSTVVGVGAEVGTEAVVTTELVADARRPIPTGAAPIAALHARRTGVAATGQRVEGTAVVRICQNVNALSSAAHLSHGIAHHTTRASAGASVAFFPCRTTIVATAAVHGVVVQSNASRARAAEAAGAALAIGTLDLTETAPVGAFLVLVAYQTTGAAVVSVV
jgi:hypothetical protein